MSEMILWIIYVVLGLALCFALVRLAMFEHKEVDYHARNLAFMIFIVAIVWFVTAVGGLFRWFP